MKPIPVGERHWTASAIVLHPSGHSVLLIDHFKSGLLLYPGGHLAAAETLAEAAIREARKPDWTSRSSQARCSSTML
jgi:8-oxo-dGTP pyrophosphatase MutT (NUDIX family)